VCAIVAISLHNPCLFFLLLLPHLAIFPMRPPTQCPATHRLAPDRMTRNSNQIHHQPVTVVVLLVSHLRVSITSLALQLYLAEVVAHTHGRVGRVAQPLPARSARAVRNGQPTRRIVHRWADCAYTPQPKKKKFPLKEVPRSNNASTESYLLMWYTSSHALYARTQHISSPPPPLHKHTPPNNLWR